jgi:hypothetical protein
MLPENTFDDQETQTIKVALTHLVHILKEEMKEASSHQPLNGFDIMSPKHTAMHALTALAKITKSPVRHFQNPLQKLPASPPIIGD